MANTKIVVLALVLVVAVPILVGYGTAFQDVEKSGWKPSTDNNITEMLNNSTAWAYFGANTFDSNGRVIYDAMDLQELPSYPLYSRFQTSPATSLQLKVTTIPAGDTITLATDGAPGTYLSNANGSVDVDVRYTAVDLSIRTDSFSAISIAWTGTHIYGIKNLGGDDYQAFDYPRGISVTFPEDDVSVEQYVSGTYADPSQGWKVGQRALMNHTGALWSMNGRSLQSILMTLDLGATDPYSFTIYGEDSDVTVPVVFTGTKLMINGETVPAKISGGELSSSENVWQLVIDGTGVKMNYIRNWPDSYGPSRSFHSVQISDASQSYTGIELESDIRYRVDYASVRSVSYPAITDNQYDPQFLLNDSGASYRISITNADVIGSSLEFGGNTYAITDGKISVGSKSVDVNGIRLDSIYDNGIRSNRINGTEVSTGPTTVTFGGTWSAVVTQSDLNYETWTEYEWQAGEWAFNGIGSDFAIVGLLTCGAVFVGLGMYGRRSGAKVGMLMLITGCAAFIFLAMI